MNLIERDTIDYLNELLLAASMKYEEIAGKPENYNHPLSNILDNCSYELRKISNDIKNAKDKWGV